MKKLLLFAAFVAATTVSMAQWEITALGETGDTITFDATMSGVNNGVFSGTGFETTPSSGQLDSDAWKFTGLSDGSSHFGGNFNTGDYAKGASAGGVFSGGVYSFGVASGDSAVGIQPTGSDWTPGTIILKIENNTGYDVDSVYLGYDLYINNNEGRGNSFNVAYSVNDSTSFTNISALNDTSIETSQGSVNWIQYAKYAEVSVSLDAGDFLYIEWSGADVTGSGSRDEFALDNISAILIGDTTASSGSVYPAYTIGTVSTTDANGVADSLGVECAISGIAIGVDLDGNAGYSFTLLNDDGININSSVDINGYQMEEGDSLVLFGTIGQFNGLIRFDVDSGVLLDSGLAIPSPTVVTSLDESTESELIRIENFWVDAISGPNHTLSDGTNTVVMRIDFDTDIPGNVDFAIGDTICYVIGIGGQFDNSSPYTEGYQFVPQRAADIDNSCGSIPPPPINWYPIPDINNDDANGEPDSIGVYCWTSGVALGVDLDGNDGLSYTLWDDEGINVYSFNAEVSNYQVQEGDSLLMRGYIDQYNGLTEFIPDSIQVINSNNTIPNPLSIDTIAAINESDLIILKNVTLADTSQWDFSSGFGWNIGLITCDSQIIEMRIDNDTDIDENMPEPPTGLFNVIGIGGQYDNSAPYLSGYQILPRYFSDIDTNSNQASGLSLIINEVMTENATSETDAAGDNDDWVEIKNIATGSASLAGLYMTNNASTPDIYMIPMESTESIAAGAYALAWCDNEPAEGDLHTNFTLDNAGDYIGIYQEEGCNLVVVDEMTIPALAADESYGVYPEGADSLVIFNTLSTTPGMMNLLIPVGLNDLDEEGKLVLYPNPAAAKQVIRFNQNIDFTLFDLLGNVVSSKRNSNELTTEGLSAGTYLLQTSTGEVLRFVIQ